MVKRTPVCKEEMVSEFIEDVKSHLPQDEHIIELADFLEAFSDFTRLKILLSLLNQELCTCDLSEITGLSASAISHQLRVLRDKKLVKYRREGRNVFYSLDDEHVAAILSIALEHVGERRRLRM